jgi:hypothetical protein
MGGAAGPDFLTTQSGEREMTQTLEGAPARSRTLGRRVAAVLRGNAIRATGTSVTAVGHRGEATAP